MNAHRGGTAHYLMYGTRHPKGLRVMKNGMWSLDPVAGQRFEGITGGQAVLFQLEPDLGAQRRTGPLGYQVVVHGPRGFCSAGAVRVAWAAAQLDSRPEVPKEELALRQELMADSTRISQLTRGIHRSVPPMRRGVGTISVPIRGATCTPRKRWRKRS